MLALAFDVGNGFVKAKNSERTIVAPSSIARKESVGFSSIMQMYDTETDYHEYSSNLDDGVTYIWGAGINDAVDPDSLIDTYTHHNRYSQKRFKLLCSFILGELASDYSEQELSNVTLVTGLPSQEIGSVEAEEYKRFLEQTHVVTRNGKQIVINVTDVRIVEQPLGTLLNEYMNENGQINRELMTSTMTVIDFGAGTTIMDTFKNLKRLDDKSETFYEGINDIHKRIARQIEKKYGVKGIDIPHIEKGFRDDSFVATLSDRMRYPFEDIAQEVIADFVEKRASDIDSTLTNRNSIDKFVLTGGGVNVVGESYQQIFDEETLKVVENSQESNLNGFYKLANSIVNK